MKNPLFILRKIVSLLPISHEKVLLREVIKIAENSDTRIVTVLDIGAGSAWYWEEIAKEVTNFTLQVTLLDAVPLDAKKSGHRQVTYTNLVGKVPEGLTTIANNEFDLVVAFDLIEHLPKADGYRLLYEIDRIAAISSMIFTPNGYVWQPPSLNNPFNAHISGWKSSEMRNLGWNQIRGHTGLKKFRGPYGLENRLVKRWPMSELDAISTLLIFRFPRAAFAYSAVKRGKNLRIENQGF